MFTFQPTFIGTPTASTGLLLRSLVNQQLRRMLQQSNKSFGLGLENRWTVGNTWPPPPSAMRYHTSTRPITAGLSLMSR